MEKTHHHDGERLHEQHSEGHPHTHIHSQQEKRRILNRIAKATGHLKAVATMVENNRDCSEILVQISAVQSAIRGTAKLILDGHIDHCIVDAVKEDDWERIEDLKEAVGLLLKNG